MKNNWFWMLMISFCALVFVAGCVSTQKREANTLFPKLKKGQSVAVSYISERSTGDVTSLGNLWRDRIEKKLAQQGMVIKARKDITQLIENAQTFSKGTDEQQIWDNANADVLVSGHYTIINTGTANQIRVTLKAFDSKTTTLLDAKEILEPLDNTWVALASRISGNIYQEEFKSIFSTSKKEEKPRLTAGLNLKNACYQPGQSALINVVTDPGVYLYIFNLSADGHVSLLYPNRWMKNKPIAEKQFVFPPQHEDAKKMELALYPLQKGVPCKESFKIVASRTKLDFSFLPVPVNQVYAGVNKRQIAKMTNVLKQNAGYSQVTLSYYISKGCE